MKRTRGLTVLALFVLLALLLTACGQSTQESGAEIVDPAENFYVSDYADVLSGDTERYIQELNGRLEAACGGQIVVVTLDFLNDLDAEQYAYEVLNQWGVGDADENNGVVLLLVPGEGKCWITVGAGLENALTAGNLESILETYFYDDFDSGNYDDAVYNTVQYLEEWFSGWYGVDLSSYAGETPANTGGREPVYAEPGYGSGRSWFVVFEIIFVLIVIVALIAIFSSMGRRRGGGGGIFFMPIFRPRPRPPRPPRTPRNPPRGSGFGGRPGGTPPRNSGMPRGGAGRSGGISRGGGMGHGGGGMGRGGGAGRK